MGISLIRSFPRQAPTPTMRGMYAILLEYTAPLDRVDEVLSEHVAWLDEHYVSDEFLAPGRREPRTGGVILARDMAPDAMMSIVAEDPFARHGVAVHDVVRFHPSKLAGDLDEFGRLLA